MVIGGGGGGGVGPSLSNDDVPHAILGLSPHESLCTEASAQEVDTPEPLPALDWVRTDAPLESSEYFRLPRPVHSLILAALDCRAKVEVDREQDVLDGDDGIPRRTCGFWPHGKQPGKVANAKCKGGLWRAGGGLGEDFPGQMWVRV